MVSALTRLTLINQLGISASLMTFSLVNTYTLVYNLGQSNLV
ncbi:hypothetical protein NIES4103_19030 [Nostoc sp. NIES-4103]|nr:hypothetical protein NIES4103_19030 [Nostoc sp. NIES-4103]